MIKKPSHNQFLFDSGIIRLAENGEPLLTFKGWIFFTLLELKFPDVLLKKWVNYGQWCDDNGVDIWNR